MKLRLNYVHNFLELYNIDYTININVVATNNTTILSKKTSTDLAERWFNTFKADNSPTEEKMVGVWMKEFVLQLKSTWSK